MLFSAGGRPAFHSRLLMIALTARRLQTLFAGNY
jgi:hypothetical protein